ncbi:PLDc N-terminal domain-containing protein [Silanimonas lenta]|uniref:PLDc N-terminal domain-containing protein n=1 Tax=Silanimonas lenta TaxID=265429 RepID=UPI002FE33463
MDVLFFLAILALAVGLFVFWGWTIIDCATDRSAQDIEKIVWLLTIILLGVLGSAIYFFVRLPSRNGGDRRRREMGMY